MTCVFQGNRNQTHQHQTGAATQDIHTCVLLCEGVSSLKTTVHLLLLQNNSGFMYCSTPWREQWQRTSWTEVGKATRMLDKLFFYSQHSTTRVNRYNTIKLRLYHHQVDHILSHFIDDTLLDMMIHAVFCNKRSKMWSREVAVQNLCVWVCLLDGKRQSNRFTQTSHRKLDLSSEKENRNIT